MREDWGKVELFRIQIGTWQVALLCDLSSPAVLPAATPFVLGLFENAYENLNEPHSPLVRYAPRIRHGFVSLLVSYRLP